MDQQRASAREYIMEQRRLDFEESFRVLEGRALKRVAYYELDYGTGEPNWRVDKGQLHSVDFGVELETEQGEVYSITWDRTFAQYDLCLMSGSLAQRFPSVPRWDVTAEQPWSDVLHRPISKTILYWSAWIEPNGDHLYYPQDLELDFHPDQRLFISVLDHHRDNDTLFGGTDNIAVTYNDETARRHRIGPFMYASSDADTSL